MGGIELWTSRQIQQEANPLANSLEGLGLNAGERVALILPQRPETAIALMAIAKIGGIVLPLANLFGPEALKYRLQNSGASAEIYDAENLEKNYSESLKISLIFASRSW